VTVRHHLSRVAIDLEVSPDSRRRSAESLERQNGDDAGGPQPQHGDADACAPWKTLNRHGRQTPVVSSAT
jgi:hypothetical protein